MFFLNIMKIKRSLIAIYFFLLIMGIISRFTGEFFAHEIVNTIFFDGLPLCATVFFAGVLFYHSCRNWLVTCSVTCLTVILSVYCTVNFKKAADNLTFGSWEELLSNSTWRGGLVFQISFLVVMVVILGVAALFTRVYKCTMPKEQQEKK